MSWAKIDDQLHSNEKFLACSLAARGLWTICLSWVADKETDGAIPRSIVRLHAGPQLQELTAELVEAGLWEVTEAGWAFHDYLAYNPSKSQLEEDRQKAADRKAAWKERQQSARTQSEPTKESRRGNDTRTARERRSVGVPNGERTEHPDPDPEVTKVTSSPPTPKEHEAPKETTEKVFAFSDPLPLHVQNFLAESCPDFYEDHLRLALVGRSPGGLASYALEILRGWKRGGKNAPQAPLPGVPALAPPPVAERLPDVAKMREWKIRQNERIAAELDAKNSLTAARTFHGKGAGHVAQ